MDNVTEIIALLRRQPTLESQILNGNGTAIASERELEATRRTARCPQSTGVKRCTSDCSVARGPRKINSTVLLPEGRRCFTLHKNALRDHTGGACIS